MLKVKRVSTKCTYRNKNPKKKTQIIMITIAIKCLNCLWRGLFIFSSSELKAQVSFSDHPLSATAGVTFTHYYRALCGC
jgi:hypothetical protein